MGKAMRMAFLMNGDPLRKISVKRNKDELISLTDQLLWIDYASQRFFAL